MERNLGPTNYFNSDNINHLHLKKKKSNTYFINNNYKVQLLDFPMNDPLHLEKEREESDKFTRR